LFSIKFLIPLTTADADDADGYEIHIHFHPRHPWLEKTAGRDACATLFRAKEFIQMRPVSLKNFKTLLHCLAVAALYALTPAMLLFERLYGGGPRRTAGAGWAGRGRLWVIGAFAAQTLYDLARALPRGRG
jgi:hypothetical protein